MRYLCALLLALTACTYQAKPKPTVICVVPGGGEPIEAEVNSVTVDNGVYTIKSDRGTVLQSINQCVVLFPAEAAQ